VEPNKTNMCINLQDRANEVGKKIRDLLKTYIGKRYIRSWLIPYMFVVTTSF